MTAAKAFNGGGVLRVIAAVAIAAMVAVVAVISQASTHTAKAVTCLPAGTSIARVKMNPQPIAAFGSLQGGQSATFSANALTGVGVCISGATLKINVTGGPGTVAVPPAQCGGTTQLSSSPVTCTTDSTGAVSMTLTAPSSIPTTGSIEVNAQGGPTTGHDFYVYEYIDTFNVSPIAASGTLTSSQSVPFILQVSGADGTPAVGIKVMLLLTSNASPSGSATANAVALTSTPKSFTSDSSGQISLVYTAPASPPSTGIDNVIAESSTTSPVVANTTSYAFQAGYPTISVGDVAQVDGDNHPDILAEFDVTLSAPQASPVTVSYITVCGVGDKGCREDYLQTLRSKPGKVTIAAGQVTGRISVNVYSYVASEPYPETFFIQLLAPTGAILGRSFGNGTIIKDDEATTAEILYVGDAGVVRSTSGNQFAEITVTLSSPTSSPVTFSYATSDGTAIAGVDYTAASGIGTIPIGATSLHIEVPILPGASPGAPLQFTVTISGPSGATIERALGTGSIM